MDGNVKTLDVLERVKVKIRPLMDGNSYEEFEQYIDELLKSDH